MVEMVAVEVVVVGAELVAQEIRHPHLLHRGPMVAQAQLVEVLAVVEEPLL
jgi:hypothetical protein